MANRTALFAKKQPGGILSVIDVGKYPGNIWFVDSGHTAASDAAGYGESPDAPFATIDYAVGNCTENNGDLIVAMPGHAETLIVAGAITCDKAGVSIVGVGVGATRPTLTFGTDPGASVLITAASVKILNIIGVAGIDALTNPFHVQAADCELDIEWRDGTSAIEAARAVLTTAAAARLKVNLVYRGFTAGDANVNAIRLVGVNGARINMDYFGLASTAVVEMITTQCLNIDVKGRFHVHGQSLVRNVVDTGGISSTWTAEGYDAIAGAHFSGGNAQALAVDDVGAVSTKVDSVGTQAGSVGTQAGSVGTQVTSVGTLTTSVGTQATSIGTQAGSVGTQVTSVGTLTTSVGTQATSIGTQVDSVGTQAGSVGTQATSVGTLTTSVGTQATSIGAQATSIGTQAGSVGTLTDSVGTLVGTDVASVGTLATSVGTQATSIGAQSDSLGTQAGSVGTLTTSVGAQATSIGTQAGSVGTQVTSVGTLTTSVGTQTGSVGTLVGALIDGAKVLKVTIADGTTIPNNVQAAGGLLATATGGDILIEEIVWQRGATSFTVATNLEFSTDNANGLTGAAAPNVVALLVKFAANVTSIASLDGSTKQLPFVLESTKKLYIHGDDAAPGAGGTTDFYIKYRPVVAGATLA